MARVAKAKKVQPEMSAAMVEENAKRSKDLQLGILKTLKEIKKWYLGRLRRGTTLELPYKDYNSTWNSDASKFAIALESETLDDVTVEFSLLDSKELTFEDLTFSQSTTEEYGFLHTASIIIYNKAKTTVLK